MYKSTHSLPLPGVNRRSFLKSSAALGLGAVALPGDRLQRAFILGRAQHHQLGRRIARSRDPGFRETDGHQCHLDPVLQNEEQINNLQATGGEGFDICQPTHDRALQFKDVGVLQPLDEKKIDLSVIVPGLLAASKSYWTWDGGLYHVPHVWGTDSISWRNDLTSIKPEEVSPSP
ncbi:MAG: substrate-binding domain-containing protein [Roseiarcus sp.]